MIKRFGCILLIGLLLVGSEARGAQKHSGVALKGRAASIYYYGSGKVDTLRSGATLFTDRGYRLKECPEWLAGKCFLRNSIEHDELLVREGGVLTILTPEPGHLRAATLCEVLEDRGFVWIINPKKFQLFGEHSYDLVRIYQKRVKRETASLFISGE